MEYNLTQIDSDLSGAFKEIEEQASKLMKQLKEEASQREIAHKVLERKLQDAIAGNYAVLAFGAVWVVIGVVISTLAPEIAKIVAGQAPSVWSAI